jgi:DNA modification methylase
VSTATNMPQHIEHLATGSLVPYARNSRTHSAEQVAQIAASIREFGFTNPVLIDGQGTIIAGHGRVMAAQALGLEQVPCIRLSHLSEAQRRAYVIADNKLALNAGWDASILALEMDALRSEDFNLDLLGFNDKELGELLDLSPTESEGKDPDATPAVEARAVAQAGDVWLLGRHRLVCGDSTNSGAYGAAIGSWGGADVVWTDPPYNVAYEGAAGSILNDDMSEEAFLAFLRAVFSCIESVMKPGAAIYVAHADAGEVGVSFRRAFLDAGLKLAQCLIWRKDQFVIGRSDYQWMHEPILYGWKKGRAHKFYGGRKQTTVSDLGSSEWPFVRRADGRWQITIGEEVMIVDGNASVDFVEGSLIRELKPKRSDLHPTMKPVALVEKMIRNSARPGAVVLDAFGGSGSTLIAAERLGMNAAVIELDPKFVDVIIRRWQTYTGQRAAHAVTGEPFPA